MIIWTRAKSTWQDDHTLLGSSAIHWPAIKTSKLSFELPSDKEYSVIISSPTSTKQIESDPALRSYLSTARSIYSFGEKTQSHLAKLGFKSASSASLDHCRGLAELAREIARSKPSEMIVYIGAKSPSFDIASFMQSKRVSFSQVAIYETGQDATELPETFITVADTPIVCFASPSAVRYWYRAMQNIQTPIGFIPLALGNTTLSECESLFGRGIAISSASVELLAASARKIEEILANKIQAVGFFDGECLFCNKTITWLLKQAPKNSLRIAALQGELSKNLLLQSLRTELSSVYSIDLVSGKTNNKSDAIIHLLSQCESSKAIIARNLLMAIPRTLRNIGYDVIAKWRHRLILSSDKACPLPSANEKKFYLE